MSDRQKSWVKEVCAFIAALIVVPWIIFLMAKYVDFIFGVMFP